MRMRCISGVLLGWLLLLTSATVEADRLYLRTGEVIEGELVKFDKQRVSFRHYRGPVNHYLKFEVEKLEFALVPEKEISVPANKRWTNTGIVLRKGDQVSFRAEGQIRYGASPQLVCDADGYRDFRYSRSRPFPNKGPGALIGKVSSDESCRFYIGRATDWIRMPCNGTLVLGINDGDVTDNQESFTVRVYLQKEN